MRRKRSKLILFPEKAARMLGDIGPIKLPQPPQGKYLHRREKEDPKGGSSDSDTRLKSN